LRPLTLCVLVLAAGCSPNQAPTAIDRLHPCSTDEGPTDAYCGELKVYENRDRRQGRTIALKIVVLPGMGSDASPDPLFFLAGGPGQGAAQMAEDVGDLFRRIQTRRDIVLVDQRGTGDSHPLNCATNLDSLRALNESDEEGLARLRKCLAGFDADPRMYTTPIAMDDLDDVRAHLGYAQINLYGGSYGTRAALVYLRQHGANVRSVVLDGVAPPDMRLPLFFARDAQRALDKLVADCESDATCGTQYPSIAARTRRLLTRLEQTPTRARLTHPRTGIAEDVTVDAAFVATILAGALYSPLTAALIPELIRRAEADDFQGLLALGLVNERASENMSTGMQLSVVCAEDYPRISADDAVRQAEGSVFAGHLLRSQVRACEFWPKGSVPASYYEPIISAVPTLVLSGDLDPVTPPSWGESVARHLQNSRHIVVPGTGHGAVATGCGARLVQEFIDRGSTDNLDTSCLEGLRRPPFFLSPAGPDPAGSRGATR
jgi:pimeloyl-ACP methyl ester carboxylesterase